MMADYAVVAATADGDSWTPDDSSSDLSTNVPQKAAVARTQLSSHLRNKKSSKDFERNTPDPHLWRALFSRYRFGRLKLYSPAPLLYIRLVLRRRCEERRFVRGLRGHVIYVALLVTMIFMQRPVDNVYKMESSISSFFGELSVYQPDKGHHVQLDTMQSLDDVWTWTTQAMLPVMLTDADTLEDGRIVIRMYNQLIGSVRLSQRRVADGKCEGTDKLVHQYSHCYSFLTPSNADDQPFGPWYDPRKYRSGGKGGQKFAEYTIDLGSDSDYAVERLLELTRTDFIGEQTRRLSLDTLFYNNAFDLFCSARVVFVLNPVGSIDVQEYYETVPADNYKEIQDWIRFAIELMIALLALQRLLGELTEIKRHVFDPLLNVRDYLFSFGNLIDWTSIIFIFISFSVWIDINANGLEGVDLMGDNNEAVEATDKLVRLSNLWKTYTVMNCIQLFLALFTFFKIFHGHEKLSIVTATVVEGASELCYFSVVYIVVNLLFMCVGSILFGSSLYEFATLFESWNTLFLIQLGAYEYTNLSEAFDGDEDQLLMMVAVFFYYSYMLVVFFILINVLLGILIDAFVTVQAKNKEKGRQIDINSGGTIRNITDMLKDEMRTLIYKSRWLASCVTGAVIPRPDAAMMIWSDERWLEVIEEICLKKRNRKCALRSSSMISLLAAMRDLPRCKNDNIFMQAHHRFLKQNAVGGFGDVWPRAFDERGVANTKKMSAKTDNDNVNQKLNKVNQSLDDLEASSRENIDHICASMEMVRAQSNRELHRKLDLVLGHLMDMQGKALGSHGGCSNIVVDCSIGGIVNASQPGAVDVLSPGSPNQVLGASVKELAQRNEAARVEAEKRAAVEEAARQAAKAQEALQEAEAEEERQEAAVAEAKRKAADATETKLKAASAAAAAAARLLSGGPLGAPLMAVATTATLPLSTVEAQELPLGNETPVAISDEAPLGTPEPDPQASSEAPLGTPEPDPQASSISETPLSVAPHEVADQSTRPSLGV